MNALAEVGLIAAREVRKNIRSAKGLVMVIISLLGGIATALVLQKLRTMDEAQIPQDQLQQIQEALLEKKYGDAEMAHYLAGAPPTLLAALLMTVWLAPLLIALLGFDAISGDLQNRAVRYWTVRASRLSYFFGKFFGLWAAVSLITLMMHVFIWIVATTRGTTLGVDAISWGLRFWAVTVPITAAWCGFAVLVGSQFRTPIIALLVTCAWFFALWILDAVGEVGNIKALTYVYPNTYDAWLLSPKPDRVALGAVICGAFVLVTAGLGATLFARRDV